MRKDFSLNWTKSNSRRTSNPFRFKQVTLACNVFLMVQGLDPNSILHSSVPSREAVDIGFLRYAQNHSTPDCFGGENKFGVWVLLVMLFLFSHERKGLCI